MATKSWQMSNFTLMAERPLSTTYIINHMSSAMQFIVLSNVIKGSR